MKQVEKLHIKYDKLQKKYWSKNLDAIYWCGCINNPKICFIFMNPTWKNISSSRNWKWLKAPWLWTKNTWKLFYKLWIISEDLQNQILNKKNEEWDYDFSKKVYKSIEKDNYYISNLSKATQDDAKPLNNLEFKEYIPLMLEEIDIIKPQIIITFWNQVSSLLLNDNKISVSQTRKQSYNLNINNNLYKVYPVYYPVWQWMRNMPKAIEDIHFILETIKK